MKSTYVSAAVCAALFLSSNIDFADRDCPPGSAERRERVVSETAFTCVTDKNIRNGPFTLVHSNGVILTLGQYGRDWPVGRWQTWYGNGAKHEDGSYSEGKRSGWWTRWHSNGQKAEEGEYRADYEQGVWRAWDEHGALVSSIPRNVDCPAPLVWRSQTPFLDLHPGGGIGVSDGRHCRRTDDVPQGPTVAWGSGGRRFTMIGSYCDGHAQGRWSFFWSNGVLAREGSFSGPSRKHGTWTDYDNSGRKLVEIEYAEGRELSRREFPRSRVELAVEPRLVNRLAVERYDAAVRQTCAAGPLSIRPYRGLRDELRAADAVAVLRLTRVKTVDGPPGWVWSEMPPLPQRIDAIVKKVLAGSLGGAGTRIQLWLAAAQHQRRSRTLPRFGDSQFWAEAEEDSEVTALVKRDGERLEIVNLLAEDKAARTDALLTEYARLAALDDDAFTIGLARLIADRIRLAPDRLLWAGWGNLAMDDWTRLPAPSLSTHPSLKKLLTETLATTLTQINAFAHGSDRGFNLHELPWLIRLLAEPERRRMAAALLRVHPVLMLEVENARRAFDKAHPATPTPEAGMSVHAIRSGFAQSAMNALMECLALCVNPQGPSRYFADDTLDRARAFVRSDGPG